MSIDKTKVQLGTGTLYLNNVDVGALKGDIVLECKRERKMFKPSNFLNVIKVFTISEECLFRASVAELKVANMKLAMGVTDTTGSSTSFPAYDPSSYAVPAGASYDWIKFGGSRTNNEIPLRFEHDKAGQSKKIIVVLYNAVCVSDFVLPFKEEEETIYDLEYRGLAVPTRAEGDRIGMILEQVMSS